ncbi:MAG TPA: oligogalacturonate lyase family protein [Candidatus Sulfopaludibacter sp.]|jgi:oligogalacturonide lyase|nr:oligogalacturonate lyase family protein [Candidatus Sulfopaludibacter sp.]
MTRRGFVMAGMAGACLGAENQKGAAFPAAWKKYSDPTTDLDVFRLTDPEYASVLTAPYNRAIARNSAWMIFSGDRGAGLQAYRIDLKNGEGRQLTQTEGLDPASLTLTPDNRSFCYFAGRSLYISSVAAMRERELYKVPEGWERCAGMSVGPDGTHATFAERRGEESRVRMVSLVQGPARTVVQAAFVLSDPVHRPLRAQILYRQADQALWLVNSDGTQNHQLKTAAGRIGTANWSPDGKTVLYLNFPEDTKQLRAIREITPDTGTEKLLAKTSQFAAFGCNRDSSVFVGASSNKGSPTILLLLRVTRRELTLCEHKATHPEETCPIFSPDSQRIYFQSDREGKSAIYSVHVEKLVEKTDVEG